MLRHGSSSVSLSVYQGMLHRAARLIPADVSVRFLAARGFADTHLMRYLRDELHWHFRVRVKSNAWKAFDADGKSVGVIFATASPFDTPFKMQELVAWTREALADGAWHPLIVIGLFVVVFLAIHPFQDGNGRLSQVLTTLLLLKAGYSYMPYSLLESVIEANKEGY